jgi:hypothetical protein
MGGYKKLAANFGRLAVDLLQAAITLILKNKDFVHDRQQWH